MRRSALLFVVTAVILAAMVLLLSMEMLPAAPTSPTATWPKGIDLPEKLPRIPR
jgi:hypothetical protein